MDSCIVSLKLIIKSVYIDITHQITFTKLKQKKKKNIVKNIVRFLRNWREQLMLKLALLS